MRSPEAFDAFYAETRERLLLETYALTGDLPAARTAVRDAFAVAWHHWPKVARLDDPAAWIRPQAHSRALHRHAARPWHRDKGLDDEVRATLEALAKLSTQERKTLVLTTLSPMPLSDIAREVGLPRGRDRARPPERYLALRDGPRRREHRRARPARGAPGARSPTPAGHAARSSAGRAPRGGVPTR